MTARNYRNATHLLATERGPLRCHVLRRGESLQLLICSQPDTKPLVVFAQANRVTALPAPTDDTSDLV